MSRSIEEAMAYAPPGFRYEFALHTPGKGYFRAKRCVDLVISTIMLALASPLMLLMALAVLSTGRPILFKQTRIGEDGKPVRVLKFRTMHASADAYAAKPGDDSAAVTRVGRVLRTFGLDELPQLVNVLRGEMSLVGPRPEMPFLVDSYDGLRSLRLSARPGVTGLWQLSPVRKQPIHDFIEYDLFYLAHRSLLFDLWILLRTPMLLFFGRHVELTRDLISRWGQKRDGSTASVRITLDLSSSIGRIEEASSVVP